jgi:ATP-dependent DNA helicase DinG
LTAPAEGLATADASLVMELLGPGGALARALPGYEHRTDQLAFAMAVSEALRERRYLAVEAGTGTGKTLAYLVPAALCGRKVVIATATKNLQEQIFFKDVPLLRDRCGLPLHAAYLKGRSNYYCLERAAEFARSPTFPTREEATLWPRIEAWSKVTQTGDRAEIDLPDVFGAWKELSATGDTCLGRECPRYEDCFVTRMRMEAATADVLVVNHHLFFADLAMRTSRPGAEVLPPYDAVIFDEAHAIEDVATEYFGLQVSSYRVEELCRDAEKAVADRPDLKELMKGLTGELWKAGAAFFGGVGDQLRGEGQPSASRQARFPGARPRRQAGQTEHPTADARAALTKEMLIPLQQRQTRLDDALEEVRGTLADADTPGLAGIARRAAELRAEISAVTALGEKSRVYFGEARGRGVFLRAAPIDVAEELVERLYKRVDTVIFTSATLCAGGSFDFFRRQVGLSPDFEVREERFDGPFDYSRQAALVVPRGLPDPQAPHWLEASAKAIRELCAVTGGRAFVLCTSTRAMQALRRLLDDLPYQLLLQGERPKNKLIEELKQKPSVLFATASFWEGVDVPGDALSLVVIDKLPFAPPGDPVIAARLAAMEETGRDGFAELQVPAAALALRQGFGRLIRTRTDRGLVAVLDRRILTRNYGAAFLATLPPCPVLETVDEARAWWERGMVLER